MRECPAWSDGKHNYLQGGLVWWRAWHLLMPWIKYRVCVSCGHKEYR